VNLRVAGAFLGRSLIWPLQLPGWRPRTQESLACQRQGGQRRTNISFARSGSGALVSAGFSTLASLVCPARNLFFSPAFLPLIDPGSTVPPGAEGSACRVIALGLCSRRAAAWIRRPPQDGQDGRDGRVAIVEVRPTGFSGRRAGRRRGGAWPRRRGNRVGGSTRGRTRPVQQPEML
jgi:hypothetical protein